MLRRMMQRLLGRQLATRLQLLDMAVIARQLVQATIAAKIDAAVPRPQITAATLTRDEQHNRAADPLHLTLRRFHAKLAVHLLKPAARIGDKARKTIRRRHARQTFDHEAAGKIADRVAAHAVGDGPEAALGIVEEGVLVDLPHTPRIRAGGRRPSKLSGKGHDNLCDLQ